MAYIIFIGNGGRDFSSYLCIAEFRLIFCLRVFQTLEAVSRARPYVNAALAKYSAIGLRAQPIQEYEQYGDMVALAIVLRTIRKRLLTLLTSSGRVAEVHKK